MKRVLFWKYQAIGNDFPLFHAADVYGIDLGQLAIKAADRKFGIGGDGILTMRPIDAQTAELRMFNPDGTEDFCGNGLRIAALHAYSQGWVGKRFALRHRDRVVLAEIHDDGSISTTIGVADYSPAAVPMSVESELFNREIATVAGKSLRGSALTTGSTHTVIPVTNLPSDAEIAIWGPAIEHDPKFPARTSVIFAKEEFPFHLHIRIWERGVGETLGCGTGSSAAAVDYLRRKSSGGLVVVDNPGGSVTISADNWQAPITISGQAELSYQGEFRVDRE